MQIMIMKEVQEETPNDNIEIVDVVNGSGTESIGQMSYKLVPEATDKYLKEWANEVKPLEHNWDVLIYEETLNDENPKGAYYSSNIIEKGVFFTKDEDGSYSVSEKSEDFEIINP